MKYLNRKFQQGGSVQQDPQQVMQQVASALQQGAKPEDVMKALVGKGIPQEQAVQMVQAVMQQMQGTPSAKHGAKLEMVKKLQMKQKGGKASTKPVPKPDPNDETWEPGVVGPGNKSMNPRDWTNEKPKAPVKPSNDTSAKTTPKKQLVPLKKQKGGYMQKGKQAASMNTAASVTSKLPKMNSQSGANTSTVPTNPDGSMKEAPKKLLSKKQKGGNVKPTIYTAASTTSKLPKMNPQSGANTSTVPTNPDGSMKTTKKPTSMAKGAKTMKAKKCLKGCGCGTKLHKEGGVISTVCSCCGTICN